MPLSISPSLRNPLAGQARIARHLFVHAQTLHEHMCGARQHESVLDPLRQAAAKPCQRAQHAAPTRPVAARPDAVVLNDEGTREWEASFKEGDPFNQIEIKQLVYELMYGQIAFNSKGLIPEDA